MRRRTLGEANQKLDDSNGSLVFHGRRILMRSGIRSGVSSYFGWLLKFFSFFELLRAFDRTNA